MVDSPVPSAPVRALAAALDALLAQAPADLPAAQALADATALVAQLERLRSVVLRVADVDPAPSTPWPTRRPPARG